MCSSKKCRQGKEINIKSAEYGKNVKYPETVIYKDMRNKKQTTESNFRILSNTRVGI